MRIAHSPFFYLRQFISIIFRALSTLAASLTRTSRRGHRDVPFRVKRVHPMTANTYTDMTHTISSIVQVHGSPLSYTTKFFRTESVGSTVLSFPILFAIVDKRYVAVRPFRSNAYRVPNVSHETPAIIRTNANF